MDGEDSWGFPASTVKRDSCTPEIVKIFIVNITLSECTEIQAICILDTLQHTVALFLFFSISSYNGGKYENNRIVYIL